MQNVDGKYAALREEYLLECVSRLQEHISERMKGVEYIDRITARAKTVKSFLKKADKKTPDGSFKYSNPFDELQDMIGARIIVFYPQTIHVVDDIIMRFYTAYEEADKQPASFSEFGYEGKHFILRMPAELLPDEIPEFFPECFELQIKTLFQHAFSEATHDLVYKPGAVVAPEQMKRTAFAAASAWGADQVLAQLVEELLPEYPSSDADS